MPYTAQALTETLLSMHDERQRQMLCRFFKTGAGEYGYGDRFIGLKCPQTRMVVKEARLKVSLPEIHHLLLSPWHEARLCGLLLLVEEMQAALPTCRRQNTPEMAARREEIATFYLQHAHRANNWDLVDMSCPKILGHWLLHPLPDGRMPHRSVLDGLALSPCLWEQRIAIVTNWMLIRHDEYADTLRIADRLLHHPHDLIHKAVGWMLREVGKRRMDILEDYLERHSHEMHRTTLRYAIEKMNAPQRQWWLEKDKKV